MALGEAERGMVLGLEACVRGTGNHIEDRAFEYSSGGNNVTYLNQFLQTEMPALTRHIRAVAQGAVAAAGFDAAIPRLGIRCIELLRYESAEGFSEVGFHEDGESTYTMVFMLSEPGHDYTGGSFEIIDNEGVSTQLERVDLGHGFLFDSERKHRVLSVSSGVRTVLVLEFWSLADSTSNDFRPGRQYGKPLKLDL
uniref:Fe2OG dioxygenase domain-containing protein n=1 Tax=Alexandrium catenella TaxID=2925 RepID=A0A7S1LYU9_ALECA|mmetsp:Transcript_16719/g.45371  ORF Transcript_16719/g.45371 Transcript_16719/m.45371 type:complete len:196 (+) Transcript_16719:1-588(+)